MLAYQAEGPKKFFKNTFYNKHAEAEERGAIQSPGKTVSSNLPSAAWFTELQDTLKKLAEAAIALFKLTTDAVAIFTVATPVSAES
jgi:hypothetical protein